MRVEPTGALLLLELLFDGDRLFQAPLLQGSLIRPVAAVGRRYAGLRLVQLDGQLSEVVALRQPSVFVGVVTKDTDLIMVTTLKK